MVNLVVLQGNLTRDPEIRYVGAKNTGVANFGVAVSRYYNKPDGSKGQDTVFVDCEAWDSGAELINKLMHKGDGIIVEGSLKMDQWEKDGQKVTKLKVRVGNFTKVHRAPKQENADQGDATVATGPVATDIPDGEDVPF